MDNQEFSLLRSRLGKTQKQLAQLLLGTSIKAVHSYEQGWRSVPVHVERQMLFLVTRKRALQEEVGPAGMLWAAQPSG
ncbi:MAG: helix-turn-helix domain-containing protein [Desulfohalobiaceae bacterium]